jgi:hypothetical protein
VYVAPEFEFGASDSVLCPSDTVVLWVRNADMINWSNQANNDSLLLTVLPPGLSIFTVEAAHKFGCYATRQFTVNSPAPMAVSSSTDLLCEGGSATLTASGVQTGTWSNGFTGTVTVVSPAATTSFSAWGETRQGCSYTASITQSVQPCFSDVYVLYPNPAGNTFTIETPGDFESGHLVLYNNLGQPVLFAQLKQGMNSIVHALPAAAYNYILFEETSGDEKKAGLLIILQQR